jgi:hypothetical protein
MNVVVARPELVSRTARDAPQLGHSVVAGRSSPSIIRAPISRGSALELARGGGFTLPAGQGANSVDPLVAILSRQAVGVLGRTTRNFDRASVIVACTLLGQEAIDPTDVTSARGKRGIAA